MCGTEGKELCPGCSATLPTELTPWCPKCGRKQAHHHDAPIDHWYSLLPYHTRWVQRAIQDIKFGGAAATARQLGVILGTAANPKMFAAGTMVTAIPLHPKRERERGFNQAEVIAKTFAAAQHLPYIPLLCRTRSSNPQARLVAAERRKNLAGIFGPVVSRGKRRIWRKGQMNIDTTSPIVLSAKHVILIDDVVTTGATASEAGAALKAMGVERIDVITVAYSALS